VLSFFPSGDLQYQAEGFVDLYKSVLESYARCETVWDLQALLFKEAVTFLFRQDNRMFTDLIETYRWVIGKKVASQTTYFEEYSRSHSAGDFTSTALDDRKELRLVLDVIDIIDELKMVRHLAGKQMEILRALVLALRELNPGEEKKEVPASYGGIYNNSCRESGHMVINMANNFHNTGISADAENLKTLTQGIAGMARETATMTNETLLLLITDVDAMRRDAEYAHKMVCPIAQNPNDYL
jgi:hypothetical protein